MLRHRGEFRKRPASWTRDKSFERELPTVALRPGNAEMVANEKKPVGRDPARSIVQRRFTILRRRCYHPALRVHGKLFATLTAEIDRGELLRANSRRRSRGQ